MIVSKYFAAFVALTLALQTLFMPALAATPDERIQLVLAANTEFYRAFRESDTSAMEALWAVDTDVSVVHPGWRQLNGRTDVLESWRLILANPNSPEIWSINVTVELRDGAAFVTCDELIGDSTIRALNIFQLHGSKWVMVFHGALPSTSWST